MDSNARLVTNDEWASAKARGDVPADYRKTLAEPVPVARCRSIARSTGERCRRWGLRGTTKIVPQDDGTIMVGGLCQKHGGSLPNVQEHAAAVIEAARLRIIGLADMAVDVLEDLALNSTADQVRLGASRDLLDRANVKGTTEIDVKVEHTLETAADRTRRHLEETAERLQHARDAETARREAIATQAADAAVRFARGIGALADEDEDIVDVEVVDEDKDADE